MHFTGGRSIKLIAALEGFPATAHLATLSGLLAVASCGGSEVSAGADDEIAPSHLAFVDVAKDAGIDVVNVCGDERRWYIPESNGTGAAWLDYDGDGDIDLFVGNGASMKYHDDGARLEVVHDASSRLYRNDGGMRFTDVTDEAGARRSDWINAIATGDIDGDGDPDLYLACLGDDVLLRNDGGRFVDATAESGLGNELWGAGAAFADVDRDGHLDLYVANYCEFDPANPPDGGKRAVYEGVEVAHGPEGEAGPGINPGAPNRFFRGRGDGTFTEATATAGFELEKALCSYACVFSDVDGDGDDDLLVANDLQPANLFINDGKGNFVEEGLARGFATNAEGQPTSAMGLLVADIDADGDQDVLRTNFDLEPNSLYINDGNGFFRESARVVGLADASFDRLAWGGGFFDADCDGDLDLLVANGHVFPQAEEIGMHPWAQQTQLFEAISSASGVTWRDVTGQTGAGLAELRSARGVAFGDPDGDGDLDAFIVDIGSVPRLLENRSERRGHWIAIELVGTASNRDGFGAVVTVYAGGNTWTAEARTANGLYSAHAPALHFGLGDVTEIERVEVRWPTAARDVQVVSSPTLDRVLTIQEEAR